MTTKQSYTAAGKALATKENAQDATRDSMRATHEFISARMHQLAKFVTHGLKPEAMLRFLMVDLQQSDRLRACTRESLYLSLLACAVTGLEPGALRGEAYIVPFANKAQFMIGWKGIVRQARRSSQVHGVTANVVREGDIFDLDLGTANSVIHKPGRSDERGDVLGAYAIAKMAGGHHEIEFLDRNELGRIRNVAERGGKVVSQAWSEWPDQMSRKSAIRRLGKRLPLGADYFAGLALERAVDDGKDQRAVLEVMTEGDAGATLTPAPPAGPITEDEAAAIAASEKDENSNG